MAEMPQHESQHPPLPSPPHTVTGRQQLTQNKKEDSVLSVILRRTRLSEVRSLSKVSVMFVSTTDEHHSVPHIHMFKQISGGKNMGVMDVGGKSFDITSSFLSIPLLNVLISSSASEFSCSHYMCVALFIHTTQGLWEPYRKQSFFLKCFLSILSRLKNYSSKEAQFIQQNTVYLMCVSIGDKLKKKEKKKNRIEQESWKEWKCKMQSNI